MLNIYSINNIIYSNELIVNDLTIDNRIWMNNNLIDSSFDGDEV